MSNDQGHGAAEKAKQAKDAVADKLEPTDEELQQSSAGSQGGSTGDSEAVTQSGTTAT